MSWGDIVLVGGGGYPLTPTPDVLGGYLMGGGGGILLRRHLMSLGDILLVGGGGGILLRRHLMSWGDILLVGGGGYPVTPTPDVLGGYRIGGGGGVSCYADT